MMKPFVFILGLLFMTNVLARQFIVIKTNVKLQKHYIFTPRDILTQEQRDNMVVSEQRIIVYNSMSDGEIFCTYQDYQMDRSYVKPITFIGLVGLRGDILELHESYDPESDWRGADLYCERIIKPSGSIASSGQAIKTEDVDIVGVNLDKVTNGDIQIVE